MMERRLRKLWEHVQGKKPFLPHFLSEVQLEGLRGIESLRIAFDYPVSVIRGANGTGNSTVLYAAACAYAAPNAGGLEFRPSALFPDYYPKLGRWRDERGGSSFTMTTRLRLGECRCDGSDRRLGIVASLGGDK